MQAPIIILVEPQLAENIGMTARAMANFGLSDLRLVAPRDGWPKKGAHSAASGASPLLERAQLFATAAEAVADLHFVFATTARERGQMKRVLGPDAAMAEAAARAASGQRAGILFGRERTGLENDEIALADFIVTFPVDPAFPSLNLAQAVLLTAYEWRRAETGGALPFPGGQHSPPAPKAMVGALHDHLEAELDAAGFFSADKRPVVVRNLRDMVARMQPSEQDVRTLRGVIRALVAKRSPQKQNPQG
ncbi:MAG TPA: RNA methyltransferase [Beijerinckiaceae bacterium]|jgi:tRNA/rRNA methyltransferase